MVTQFLRVCGGEYRLYVQKKSGQWDSTPFRISKRGKTWVLLEALPALGMRVRYSEHGSETSLREAKRALLNKLKKGVDTLLES